MTKEIITYEIKFPIGNKNFLTISAEDCEKGNFLAHQDQSFNGM
jgi:hypothetical protein